MKRILTTIILAILNIVAIAQSFPKDLSVKEFTSISAYGLKIPVKKYSFNPYHCVYSTRSIDSELIYVYLENEDYQRFLLCVDINGDSIVYAHKMKDRMVSVHAYRDYYTVFDGRETHIYNSKTGNENWFVQGYLLQVDERNKVGIDMFGAAHDMYTGTEKWQNKINLAYGIDNLYAADSNWMIFSANGLQFINTKMGTGWYHYLKTGLDDKSGSKPINRYTRSRAMMYQIRPNLLWYANSNIYYNNDNYYFAGIDEMICVSMAGNLLWRVSLPEASGASYLESINGVLYLISLGYTMVNNSPAYYSNPFIASFEEESGKLLYFTPLSRRTTISDYGFFQDKLLITCSDAISVYDSKTCQLQDRIQIDNTDSLFGKYKFIYQGDNIYTDSSFNSTASLRRKYPDYFFMSDGRGSIMALHKTLKTYDTLSANNLYYKSDRNNNTSITYSKGKVFIDKNGKRILNHATLPDWQIGDRFVFIEKSEMYVTNLATF